MPSQVPEGGTRGWIIPIGGGEEKQNDPQILRRFVALCGGADADIAVIPTASRLADTGARYEVAFRALGAGRVAVLDFDSRGEAADPGKLEFKGLDYLLGFALPNLNFHATCAYAILRHNGVELGKADYIGPAD